MVTLCVRINGHCTTGLGKHWTWYHLNRWIRGSAPSQELCLESSTATYRPGGWKMGRRRILGRHRWGIEPRGRCSEPWQWWATDQCFRAVTDPGNPWRPRPIRPPCQGSMAQRQQQRSHGFLRNVALFLETLSYFGRFEWPSVDSETKRPWGAGSISHAPRADARSPFTVRLPSSPSDANGFFI